jgi:hypothetical protein
MATVDGSCTEFGQMKSLQQQDMEEVSFKKK